MGKVSRYDSLLEEALNADKKEGQRQDQGKAQEAAGRQGDHPQKDRRQKKVAKALVRHSSPKKATLTANAAVKPRPSGPSVLSVAVTPMPSLHAQPAPPGERIGVVTHYYSHLSVATLRLKAGTLRVGDVIPHPRKHHRPTKAVSFVISNDGRNVRYWHKADN